MQRNGVLGVLVTDTFQCTGGLFTTNEGCENNNVSYC